MYCVNGESRSSLLIESTDSMIYIYNKLTLDQIHIHLLYIYIIYTDMVAPLNSLESHFTGNNTVLFIVVIFIIICIIINLILRARVKADSHYRRNVT